MEQKPNPKTQPPKERAIPTVLARLDDGRIAEMVYRPEEKRSAFAVWDGEEWSLEASMPLDPVRRLVPYSPENNLVRNEVVLFASVPEEYGSEDELVAEI